MVFIAAFSFFQQWKFENIDKPRDITRNSEYISDEELQKFQEINEDFVGYLYIPNTQIDFPVVKGTDNSYYLSHSFEKEKSHIGCPFVDYRLKETDRNTVIHGHNFGKDRTEIFSTLIKYQNRNYFFEHPKLYYAELGESGQKYQIFSVFNFNVKELTKFDYMQRDFKDDVAFLDWIEELKSRSLFETDVPVSKESQVVILSTCNREYGKNNRLLICAVK